MKACDACPWRKENQGKRTPGGWYTKKNLQRLWAGLRRGESMSCHPTDPRMTLEDYVCPEDYQPAKEGVQTQECAGGLILQQREIMIAQDRGDKGFRRYRRERPFGMTLDGIRVFIERAIFGRPMGVAMPTPDMNDESIYYKPLT